MNTRDDVLIIGGGVIGLCCAYFLRKSGLDVRLLERFRIGSGSSHGNCGTITPSHAAPLAEPGLIPQALRWMLQSDAPLYIRPRLDFELIGWLMRFARRCNAQDWRATAEVKAKLLRNSRELLADLVTSEQLDCEFSESGLLYVYRDIQNAAKAEEKARVFAELGIEAQPWSSARLGRDEPSLKAGLAGGLLFPGDAQLRPERLLVELQRVVLAMGVRIETGCEVESIHSSADSVLLRTDRGEHRADHAVLAAGAWSGKLARQLDLRLPVQPGKGYSITYGKRQLAPRRPLVLKERSVCVTAWSSGFRLGSTMEFSGYDGSLNRRRLDALERGAGEYLRGVIGADKREEWYGWRPMTYDDLPIIGPAPGHERLMLATGHGMLGVSLAAITGQLVAELVGGHEPSIDVVPFSAARF